MAQWDVYENPSPRAREDLPFVIDVQSDLLSVLRTRLVVPCEPTRATRPGLPWRMTPVFEITGKQVRLVPNEAGSLDATMLRRPIASLRGQSHLIIDALDAVVSGV